jgi:hypothetical protein
VASNRYVPRSIQNIFDRLEARNERSDKESFSTELPKIFQVTVYASESPATRSPTTQASSTSPSGVDNFDKYRARSLAGHNDWLSAPETAKFRGEYERLRNAHFQAFINKNNPDGFPKTGDVWMATYLGGNLVELTSLVRSGAFVLRLEEDNGPAQNAHTNGQAPTTTVAAASATTAANGQYSQAIQNEINKKGCKEPKVFVINDGCAAFITKIKSSTSFRSWSGPALAGVVANAQGESNYVQSAPGDPAMGYGGPNVSTNRKKEVKDRQVPLNGKGYCSWGYWQFNICPESAAGSELASDEGINMTTTEGKAKWLEKLKDDEFQFKFAAKKMASITAKTGSDPYTAGSDIVLKFEKPACMNIHALERGNLAVLIYNKFKAQLDAP